MAVFKLGRGMIWVYIRQGFESIALKAKACYFAVMARMLRWLFCLFLALSMLACPRRELESIQVVDPPRVIDPHLADGGIVEDGDEGDEGTEQTLDPVLESMLRAAGEGAAFTLLLHPRRYAELRRGSDRISSSLVESMGLNLEAWSDWWGPKSLLERLSPELAAHPPDLVGLDAARPWVMAVGDARLGIARAALLSALPLGTELRQVRLLHRIVLPASNPLVLVDSLKGWLLAEGLDQTLKVIPGEHWVRVDLCLGECSDSFSAVLPELGPRTPVFLAFAARGEGLYVRRWRLREFFAVHGLIGLFDELEEVSAEERVPLSFALHRRVLGRWSATGPKPGDVMDQSVLVDDEGDDWRLIESHAESGGSWDVPEVYAAGGAGQACLDRLVLHWLKEKPEDLQLEQPAEREDLECAAADPITRLLAEEMRWMRLRYRARRLALVGERSRGLVLLKESCEQGLARACELALAWHAQAEPELFASELRQGFAPPAFGLVRRVLLDRAGRLRGAEGLEKGEPFQLWIDRRCPWWALAPQLVVLSAGRVEPRVPVALRDPVRGLRLLSIWLEWPKKAAGRKLGGLSRLGQGQAHAKTSTRVELELDGLKLQFRGPGGQVVLPAPAACQKIDCWNLDALKKLLTDERIEKLNPRFIIRATKSTPWENVATLMLLLRELGAEILVNPRVL